MTMPLLQYVARFNEGGDIVGFKGEVIRRVGRSAPCLSNYRLYLLRLAANY